MNRKCYDIGIIFHCCIFVIIMRVCGRPISTNILNKNILNTNGVAISEDRISAPEEFSTDLFPLTQTTLEENDSSSRVKRHRMGINVSYTPEYMLELYNKLSNNKPFLHNSNIIRSFVNLPITDDENRKSIPNQARRHSLTFNISTLDKSETINLAEIRLYTLIKRDQHSFRGISRFVSIYEVVQLRHGYRIREKHNYITSKYINSIENAWESFDVTTAVKRSVKHDSDIQKLEVRISSLLTSTSNDNMDFNANSNEPNQPILVVYSNDNSPKHEHAVERHELVMHSVTSDPDLDFRYSTLLTDSSRNIYTNPQHDAHERVKRSRFRNSMCHRRPMFVNFADIGLDFIIAPRGYQAYQCAGRCIYPLGDQEHPTQHAIIQMLMRMVHPRRAARVCCVPTKLEPISILYRDEYGVVTYKYSYDGMVVSECGCR